MFAIIEMLEKISPNSNCKDELGLPLTGCEYFLFKVESNLRKHLGYLPRRYGLFTTRNFIM
jgi:hypothetical protein